MQQNGGVFLGDAPPLPRVEEASHEIGGRAAVDLRALSIVADRHKPRVVAFLLLLHLLLLCLLLGAQPVQDVVLIHDAGDRHLFLLLRRHLAKDVALVE